MLEITPAHYMVLSSALFMIGAIVVMVRRNIIIIFMSIELMLNAVNINLIAAASHLEGLGRFAQFDGQIIAIFVITVAAAEVALALAIVLRLYRTRASVNVDEVNLMRW